MLTGKDMECESGKGTSRKLSIFSDNKKTIITSSMCTPITLNMNVRRMAIRRRLRMDPTLFIRHRHTFFSFWILLMDFRDRIDNITLVSLLTVGAFLC